MSLGKVVPIAGYPVHEATPEDLAIHLLSVLRHGEKISLLFANSNFIVKCKTLMSRMVNDSVLIVNDGIGLDIVAKLLRGRPFKANLNGTDFTPYLFRESARPLRVFMLGAQPHIVKKAVEYVERELGQVVVGYADGYGNIDDPNLFRRINQSEAEVLLVALGNPLQEEWILNHRDKIDVGVVTGVGALFDFWAGSKPRAPEVIQRMRMEWLFRLAHEPRRLMRRYTVDMLVFFTECFRNRKSQPEEFSTEGPPQARYQ